MFLTRSRRNRLLSTGVGRRVLCTRPDVTGSLGYFLLYLIVRFMLSVSSKSVAVTFTFAFVLMPFIEWDPCAQRFGPTAFWRSDKRRIPGAFGHFPVAP